MSTNTNPRDTDEVKTVSPTVSWTLLILTAAGVVVGCSGLLVNSALMVNTGFIAMLLGIAISGYLIVSKRF